MKENLDLKVEVWVSIFRVRSEKWLFMSFWFLNYQIYIFMSSWYYYVVCKVIITSVASGINGLVHSLTKNLLLYRSITSSVNGSRMQKFHSSFIFLFYVGFLRRYWRFPGQQRKGRGHLYSSLSFALVHEYLLFICSFVSDMTNFCFSFAANVITRILLYEIYQLLPIIKCNFIYVFILFQIFSNFPQTSSRFEFVSTVTITTIQVS